MNQFHSWFDHIRRKTSLTQIAFAQIQQLGYKRAQYGTNGIIINVLVDFDKV